MSSRRSTNNGGLTSFHSNIAEPIQRAADEWSSAAASAAAAAMESISLLVWSPAGLGVNRQKTTALSLQGQGAPPASPETPQQVHAGPTENGGFWPVHPPPETPSQKRLLEDFS